MIFPENPQSFQHFGRIVGVDCDQFVATALAYVKAYIARSYPQRFGDQGQCRARCATVDGPLPDRDPDGRHTGSRVGAADAGPGRSGRHPQPRSYDRHDRAPLA